MITVKEAAARLGLSVYTVYELCYAGRLAHYKLGAGSGAIRIRLEDIEAYIESCRVETGARQHKPTMKLRWIK